MPLKWGTIYLLIPPGAQERQPPPPFPSDLGGSSLIIRQPGPSHCEERHT